MKCYKNRKADCNQPDCHWIVGQGCKSPNTQQAAIKDALKVKSPSPKPKPRKAPMILTPDLLKRFCNANGIKTIEPAVHEFLNNFLHHVCLYIFRKKYTTKYTIEKVDKAFDLAFDSPNVLIRVMKREGIYHERIRSEYTLYNNSFHSLIETTYNLKVANNVPSYLSFILDYLYQEAIRKTVKSTKITKLTLTKLTKEIKVESDFMEIVNKVGALSLMKDIKGVSKNVDSKILITIARMRSYQVPAGIYVMLDDLEKAIKKNKTKEIKRITDSMLTYGVPSGFLIELDAIREAYSVDQKTLPAVRTDEIPDILTQETLTRFVTSLKVKSFDPAIMDYLNSLLHHFCLYIFRDKSKAAYTIDKVNKSLNTDETANEILKLVPKNGELVLEGKSSNTSTVYHSKFKTLLQKTYGIKLADQSVAKYIASSLDLVYQDIIEQAVLEERLKVEHINISKLTLKNLKDKIKRDGEFIALTKMIKFAALS